MRVPLGAGGVLLLGMYRLEPNWWVQSGAGECKGSRPTLPESLAALNELNSISY